MNQTYQHTFTEVLQPFYLYLQSQHSIVNACVYDGSSLVITINETATSEQQTALTSDVNSYIVGTLDIIDFEVQYAASPHIAFETPKKQNTSSFHSHMERFHSDWFSGVGQGKGKLHIFCNRVLTLSEEIILFDLANQFIAETLDLSLYDLQYEIKQGIQVRKQIGNNFVENQYTAVMLGVVTGDSNEAFSNLVEETFHPAIVHMQNGLFISSYNAVLAVDPVAVVPVPELQTAISDLKESYKAIIYQLCQENYPQALLANTPSMNQTP